jgi:hypothetical protein
MCDEFDIDEYDNEETTCPCGCDDDPKYCVYASTCVECGEKYFGRGYGEKTAVCFSCQALHPEKYLPCGHSIEHHSLMLETGKFYCGQCGVTVQ